MPETEDGVQMAVRQENIKHILKAGWSLLALINELMDLTLIEPGKMALARGPVSAELFPADELQLADRSAEPIQETLKLTPTNTAPFTLLCVEDNPSNLPIQVREFLNTLDAILEPVQAETLASPSAPAFERQVSFA